MADWAKIALKTGLVAVIMVALWAVFTQIQLPVLDFSIVFGGFSKALAIIYYWVPAMQVIWPFTLVLLGIWLGLWTFRFSMIAIRWLLKVNE